MIRSEVIEGKYHILCLLLKAGVYSNIEEAVEDANTGELHIELVGMSVPKKMMLGEAMNYGPGTVLCVSRYGGNKSHFHSDIYIIKDDAEERLNALKLEAYNDIADYANRDMSDEDLASRVRNIVRNTYLPFG
jgi:hypothetical protein